MSLATRCTSCGTAFRVVQDQLKVSEGWVRCGRCDAVFNALEGLFDLGRDAPPGWEEPPAPQRRRRRAACGRPASAARADDARGDPSSDADEGGGRRGRRRRADVGPRRAARRSDRRPSVRPAQARRKRAEAGRPARPARPRRVLRRALRFRPVPRQRVGPRHASWRLPIDRRGRAAARERRRGPIRPARRSARALAELAGAHRARRSPAPLAPLVLALQAAHHYRDTRRGAMAVAAPGARRRGAASRSAASRRRAGSTRCSVESTALTRAAAQDAFVLSVTLRSRSAADARAAVDRPDASPTRTAAWSRAGPSRRATSAPPTCIAPQRRDGAAGPAQRRNGRGRRLHRRDLLSLNPARPHAALILETACPPSSVDRSPSTASPPSAGASPIRSCPNQLHVLNVSFLVPTLRREFGGCAGNIAYNLAALGGEPVVVAAVGADGSDYLARLRSWGATTDHVRSVADAFTAQAFIITDLDNNQITAFHPGAMQWAHETAVPARADIAHRDRRARRPHRHARSRAPARRRQHSVHLRSGPGPADVRRRRAARVRRPRHAGSPSTTTRRRCSPTAPVDRSRRCRARTCAGIVVTLGARGLRGLAAGREDVDPGVAATEVVDPTGCGDAFRAAMLFGLERGWPLADCARLGNRARRAQDRQPRRPESCAGSHVCRTLTGPPLKFSDVEPKSLSWTFVSRRARGGDPGRAPRRVRL